MTAMDTTARNATGVAEPSGAYNAGSVISSATPQPAMIALTGVRLRSTFDHSRQPGTAPSRENAYVMRDIEVTQLMPQKNCPIVEMPKMTVARVDDSDEVKMAPTKPPSALT